MKELYSDETIAGLNKKLNRRWLLLGLAEAVLLALLVVSVAVRMEWLSMSAVILMGFIAIFWIELLCLPLISYRKLVQAALSGRSHTVTMEYVRTDPDPSMVDGVSCLSLIFLGTPDKHGEREQLFYWDREITLPALEPARQYTVRYTGKNIVAIGA